MPLNPMVLLAEADAGSQIYLTDIVGTVIVLGAIIGVVAFIAMRLTRVSSLEESNARAEAEFARKAMEELGVTGPLRPSPPAAQQSISSREFAAATAPPAPAPPFPAAPMGRPAPPAPAEVSAAAAPSEEFTNQDTVEAESVEDLASRLQRLNIIGEREGTVRLAHQPDALMYRLRSGGLCLLMPRMEGEETMLRLTRRFDMLFVLCRRGEVLVLERYQSRLPALLDSPGQPPRL